MRLICTINSKDSNENPYEFSYFLTTQKIANECDEEPCGHDSVYRIWIYDEDHVEKARAFYDHYRQNPNDPRFRIRDEEAILAQEQQLQQEDEKESVTPLPPQKRRLTSHAPYGKITIFILLVSIFLFFAAIFQKGIQNSPQFPGIAPAPIVPPIEKSLIYDYPAYFELRDQLFAIYTPKEIESGKTPPPEALTILKKMEHTPFWIGIYDRIIQHIHKPSQPIAYHGPLFEKISQGEVWRLVTPAVLHYDLLHIFFNILWFMLLSHQIEFRIGALRYILFFIVTAAVSNTAQYLMSGPFFMGLSGVVCAMAAFIWARQQVAPWEGYLLNKLTLIFLAIFIFGILALQITFFVLQLYGYAESDISIANTAHLSGALTGYLLGRLRFFALRQKR